MTFALRNLSVLAYAQGFTLWHYRGSACPLARATAPGFFNPAADLIAAGDMLLVSAADGGRVLFVATSSEAAGVATTSLAA
jgi:hypothetical protein